MRGFFIRIGRMVKYNFAFQKNKALNIICLTKTLYLPHYFCSMKKQYGFLRSLLWIFVIGFNVSCNDTGRDEENDAANSVSSVPSFSYSLISILPHDTSSFTEGLEFYNSTLLESTGLKGSSKLVQYDPKTGKALKQFKLDSNYFGEGITVLRDTLYQLTYQENVVFLYNVKTFKKIKELSFKGEGWGLTNDGKDIIASNGSSSLYYYEPGTMKLLKVVNVSENGNPVPNINELEYVDGYIYSNQWQYNYIIKIDPKTGNVVAKSDFTDLVKRTNTSDRNVLNGIAYNKTNKKFYVTGKNWPTMYEIEISR
jgi:glutaminyl-peptide cyclotransferase